MVPIGPSLFLPEGWAPLLSLWSPLTVSVPHQLPKSSVLLPFQAGISLSFPLVPGCHMTPLSQGLRRLSTHIGDVPSPQMPSMGHDLTNPPFSLSRHPVPHAATSPPSGLSACPSSPLPASTYPESSVILTYSDPSTSGLLPSALSALHKASASLSLTPYPWQCSPV